MRSSFLLLGLVMACGPSKGPRATNSPPEPGHSPQIAMTPAHGANASDDDPSGDDPSGDDPSDDEAFDDEAAVRVIDPRTFVSRVDALGPAGPESSGEAMALFLAAFTNPDPAIDEALRRQALERLLAYMSGNIPRLVEEQYEQPHTDAAICLMSGACEQDDVELTAEAMARYYRSVGLTTVYEGEGLYRLDTDYAWFAKRLAPALSKASALYLEAKAWQANKVDTAWDETGFIGDPKDIVTGIVIWERLITMSEAWAEAGRDGARAVSRDYLGICVRWSERPECTVSADDRKSYTRFMAEHRESMARPAVAHFVKAMKGRKWRAGENAHHEVREASMKKIRDPRPRAQ